LVTCERCQKKFRSYAALKDHWVRRHPNVPFPDDLENKLVEEKELQVYKVSSHVGKGSRRLVTVAALIVIVLIGVAAIAIRQINQTVSITQNTAQTTFTFNIPTSNTVWNDQLFPLNGTFSWIQAKLNPLSKTDYKAYGHIEMISGCFTFNATATGGVGIISTGQITCPSVLLTVLNRTGLEAWQTETIPHARIYYSAKLASTGMSDFTLTNLDYDGLYYFTFEVHQFQNLPNPVISITLTETWAETQTITETTKPTSFLVAADLKPLFQQGKRIAAKSEDIDY